MIWQIQAKVWLGWTRLKCNFRGRIIPQDHSLGTLPYGNKVQFEGKS